jgi:hypothetical protein
MAVIFLTMHMAVEVREQAGTIFDPAKLPLQNVMLVLPSI